MIRILVVDDHGVVRQGLRQILKDALPDASFGEAGTAEDAVRKVREASWDIVVLDISLPDKSGLDVLKELGHTHPGLPVLVLSMYPEEQFAVRVLRAGAAGYLAKQAAPADLVIAVQKVLSGGKYVSPSVAERLIGEIGRSSGRAPHELLSDREFQVFRLLASGKPVKAIAESLDLSVPTVSTYRARVLEKMGVAENSDLVQYAVVNRLLE